MLDKDKDKDQNTAPLKQPCLSLYGFGKSYGRVIFCIAVIAWVFVFLIAIGNGLIRGYGVSQWGSVGDVFNIFTSLSAVVTVILLVIAVTIQRKELRYLKKELKISRKAIESQIAETQKSTKVTITLQLIAEWNDVVLAFTPEDVSQHISDHLQNHSQNSELIVKIRNISNSKGVKFIKKLIILESHPETQASLNGEVLREIINSTDSFKNDIRQTIHALKVVKSEEEKRKPANSECNHEYDDLKRSLTPVYEYLDLSSERT